MAAAVPYWCQCGASGLRGAAPVPRAGQTAAVGVVVVEAMTAAQTKGSQTPSLADKKAHPNTRTAAHEDGQTAVGSYVLSVPFCCEGDKGLPVLGEVQRGRCQV